MFSVLLAVVLSCGTDYVARMCNRWTVAFLTKYFDSRMIFTSIYPWDSYVAMVYLDLFPCMKQAFNNLFDYFVLSPLIWLSDTMCPVQDFLIWLCCTLSHYLICLYTRCGKNLDHFYFAPTLHWTKRHWLNIYKYIYIYRIPLIRSHLWVELMH